MDDILWFWGRPANWCEVDLVNWWNRQPLPSGILLRNRFAVLRKAQKKLEELFHAADDDGDGNLSPAEFTEASPG